MRKSILPSWHVRPHVWSPLSSVRDDSSSDGWILAVGFADLKQEQHAIRRNFPVLGNIRYLFESIRPEIRQYFIEGDSESVPFSREERSITYQRAKGFKDTLPFGTRRNVKDEGYEWCNHSMYPHHLVEEHCRVLIGGPDCKQPYSAALLNVSAMSYGALSDNAVLALNEAAAMGNFYHNTGEGGVSEFHRRPGGDLVWNMGTGYFGACTPEGNFSEERFKLTAAIESVKMIEIKLSQGAKPAHGGMLPGAKVTKYIAEARGVPIGTDCNSPPRHSAFSTPSELVDFIAKLRVLSEGKPIGFKLCVGRPEEIAAVVRAMTAKNIYPDFITVDGGEGGTGAAPPEFSNSIGMPLEEGLHLVNSLLVGAGIRDRVKVICSGRVLTGMGIVRNLAIGADLCNSARAMMFALGCIQALKCDTNHCPTGITTQDPDLMRGLVVSNKATRVYNFQKKTVETALEMIGAIGLRHPDEVRGRHVYRRVSHTEVRALKELFPREKDGSLLDGTASPYLLKIWAQAEDLVNAKPGSL